jgi:hypothetical protein
LPQSAKTDALSKETTLTVAVVQTRQPVVVSSGAAALSLAVEGVMVALGFVCLDWVVRWIGWVRLLLLLLLFCEFKK